MFDKEYLIASKILDAEIKVNPNHLPISYDILGELFGYHLSYDYSIGAIYVDDELVNFIQGMVQFNRWLILFYIKKWSVLKFKLNEHSIILVHPHRPLTEL